MSGSPMSRLPLPNFKVYTAASVAVLSIAAYYAIGATSDPSWRMNATIMRYEALLAAGKGRNAVPIPILQDSYGPRSFIEMFMDVFNFMVQEPLCIWTLINIAYCALLLFGKLVQRFVFGPLRVAEAQRLKDKFWNYLFYKFIFIFGVVNVQYMEEVLLWLTWFTVVGFLNLMTQLCKDRYEYLHSTPDVAFWAHVRLLGLVVCNLVATTALFAAVCVWNLPNNRDTFAFMAAECVLLMVSGLYVVARYLLHQYQVDVAEPLHYYTHFTFDAVSLMVELAHTVHMVIFSNMLVSMASLVLLMQLRHLLHELQARLRKHRLYTSLATHMSKHYPMASREEVEKNEDKCAICWEPMKEARKLPCSHLFHNSCLCRWMQQDATCPTCRRVLTGPTAAPRPHAPRPPHDPLAPRAPNHFFHFDGSRYVSWLPSFSVEVTRVRDLPPLPPLTPPAPGTPAPAPAPAPAPGTADPAGTPAPARHDDPFSLAEQVHQMFPQYSVTVLAADLALTLSVDHTLENILEGRLQPNLTNLPAEPTPNTNRPGTVDGSPASPPHEQRADDSSEYSDVEEEREEREEQEVRRFSSSAAERHRHLRRRKELLRAAARRRYLQRHHAAATTTTTPGDT